MDAGGREEADDRRDLDRCRSGDLAGLEGLYRRHAPGVYGFALRILRRPDLAEDVVQDTFLLAQRNAASFRGESRVGTWIHAIALNAARMRLRSERRAPPVLSEDQAAAVPAPAPPGSLPGLLEALNALDSGVRELVLLAAQGNSYEEIASLLGLTADQVRGRLHRARKALLAQLDEKGDGGA